MALGLFQAIKNKLVFVCLISNNDIYCRSLENLTRLEVATTKGRYSICRQMASLVYKHENLKSMNF